MAEMMEMLQKRLEFAFLGGRFWIFAQIGALLVLLTSFKPFFWEYNIPALLVLLGALTWDLWRNAPKAARYGISLLTLVVFMWLLANTLMVQYFDGTLVPSSLHDYQTGMMTAYGLAATNNSAAAVGVMAEVIPDGVAGINTLLMGAIGGVLMLISGLMGLMAARRA